MTRHPGYMAPDTQDLAGFRSLIDRSLSAVDVPFAAEVLCNVPVYDADALRPTLADPDRRRALMAEWAWVIGQSAGVIVLRGACPDLAAIDRATGVFQDIITQEAAAGAGKGDHFAAAGANARIWNALQKHCLRDPEGFALYFGSPVIAAAAEAWLGPHYQVTAQVNLVRPGGQAQQAHRDYHLGFQSAATAARFPRHAHLLTAALTLQGGIAHCDMPVDSGPTKLLPFSQLYEPGYLAFHDAAHRDLFEERYIQLPLAKGDALFFNPALFHAAGENRSADIERLVNLLQISSAFGRAMEAVDRHAMSLALYPALARLASGGRLDQAQCDAAIAATAEGYSFPTNLDNDPPIGGNAPVTQADVLREALHKGWTGDALAQALTALHRRQQA